MEKFVNFTGEETEKEFLAKCLKQWDISVEMVDTEGMVTLGALFSEMRHRLAKLSKRNVDIKLPEEVTIYDEEFNKPTSLGKEPQYFRIVDSWGEIDITVDWDIIKVIQHAWNYEADVYAYYTDGTDDIIFSGWEDNETLSDWLAPYDLQIADTATQRVLQTVSTGEIHLGDWQK